MHAELYVCAPHDPRCRDGSFKEAWYQQACNHNARVQCRADKDTETLHAHSCGPLKFRCQLYITVPFNKKRQLLHCRDECCKRSAAFLVMQLLLMARRCVELKSFTQVKICFEKAYFSFSRIAMIY